MTYDQPSKFHGKMREKMLRVWSPDVTCWVTQVLSERLGFEVYGEITRWETWKWRWRITDVYPAWLSLKIVILSFLSSSLYQHCIHTFHIHHMFIDSDNGSGTQWITFFVDLVSAKICLVTHYRKKPSFCTQEMDITCWDWCSLLECIWKRREAETTWDSCSAYLPMFSLTSSLSTYQYISWRACSMHHEHAAT